MENTEVRLLEEEISDGSKNQTINARSIESRSNYEIQDGETNFGVVLQEEKKESEQYVPEIADAFELLGEPINYFGHGNRRSEVNDTECTSTDNDFELRELKEGRIFESDKCMLHERRNIDENEKFDKLNETNANSLYINTTRIDGNSNNILKEEGLSYESFKTHIGNEKIDTSNESFSENKEQLIINEKFVLQGEMLNLSEEDSGENCERKEVVDSGIRKYSNDFRAVLQQTTTKIETENEGFTDRGNEIACQPISDKKAIRVNNITSGPLSKRKKKRRRRN